MFLPKLTEKISTFEVCKNTLVKSVSLCPSRKNILLATIIHMLLFFNEIKLIRHTHFIAYKVIFIFRWNGLLGYNVSVIMIKTILQIVGCIFIKDVELYACWFVQLLGIGCIQKFDVSSKGFSDADCNVPREDIGLAWDGVCFAFLLLQKRLFNSFNFFHIIDETKAAAILASRGAELIEDLRDRQMSLKADEEGKILEKIKQKMDRIKANQQKIQGPSYQDASSHFVGKFYRFVSFKLS